MSYVRPALRPIGAGRLPHALIHRHGSRDESLDCLAESMDDLRPAHRLLLCLVLILGGCLMTFYLQVLDDQMVRAPGAGGAGHAGHSGVAPTR